MKPADSKDIKAALTKLESATLREIILRLARLKKENKELLTYILFDAADKEGYVAEINHYVTQQMGEVNVKSAHFARKSLRRILKTAWRLVKYSGDAECVIQVNLHLLEEMNKSKIPFGKSTALENIRSQVKAAIEKNLKLVHADLAHDFKRQLQKMENG